MNFTGSICLSELYGDNIVIMNTFGHDNHAVKIGYRDNPNEALFIDAT